MSFFCWKHSQSSHLTLWKPVFTGAYKPYVSPMGRDLPTSLSSAPLPSAALHTLAFNSFSVIPHTCCLVGLPLLFLFCAVLIPAWVSAHISVCQGGLPQPPWIKCHMYAQWCSLSLFPAPFSLWHVTSPDVVCVCVCLLSVCLLPVAHKLLRTGACSPLYSHHLEHISPSCLLRDLIL